MNLFDELLDLFMPTNCGLCDRAGSPVCFDCLQIYEKTPMRVTRGGLSGYAVAEYSPITAKLISEFKEQGQTSIFRSLSVAMTSVFEAGLTMLPGQSSDATLWVVPVPSSRESMLRRGYTPSREIARPMVAQLRRRRVSVQLIDPLRYGRKVLDQSGLSVSDRELNLRGSMKSRYSLAGREIVLVDDVCTTGATLLEAARACEQAGASVKFFCTFAETKRKLAT